MSFFGDIGSSIGGFFGQQDDELKKALAQTANMKNTQAILSQGADASAPAFGSQADILARENAGMGLSPEESQQQIASSIGTPNVENVDLSGGEGWDLKGMAKAFLGDGEAAAPAVYKHDMSLQYGAGAKPVVQPVQAQMPQKPQQSQAANAIMAAMQNNQQMQPQAAQQPQPSMFQKMMGFA